MEEVQAARAYEYSFGTLYTVEYDPATGTAHYAWPDRDLLLTPESPETALVIHFNG